jgi:hypothetical protein
VKASKRSKTVLQAQLQISFRLYLTVRLLERFLVLQDVVSAKSLFLFVLHPSLKAMTTSETPNKSYASNL